MYDPRYDTDSATVSAPIFRPISLLDVYTGGERSTFGVFGYCVGGGSCSNRGLGYNLPGVISNLVGSNYANQNIVRLTRALVLHPIACGTSLFSLPYDLIYLGYISAPYDPGIADPQASHSSHSSWPPSLSGSATSSHPSSASSHSSYPSSPWPSTLASLSPHATTSTTMAASSAPRRRSAMPCG